MGLKTYFPEGCDEHIVGVEEERGLADILVSRAASLPEKEREWVRAVFESHQKARGVAALVGMSPRAFRYRLSRVVRRVLSPEYAFVVHSRWRWPVLRRAIATGLFIEGKTARVLSEELGMSYRGVRRERQVILAMFEPARSRYMLPFQLAGEKKEAA